MLSKSPTQLKPPTLDVSDLLPGDVVLCYSHLMADEHPEIAGYCHVAICLESREILQADSDGVTVVRAEKLLDSYDHLAVLRAREFWDDAAVAALVTFASEVVGAPFNQIGMARVPERQQKLAEAVMSDIENYFADGLVPPRHLSTFFCSQLVAESLIRADVVTESASIALRPSTTSPKSISYEGVYGRFAGYILTPGYIVPDGDRFRGRW